MGHGPTQPWHEGNEDCTLTRALVVIEIRPAHIYKFKVHLSPDTFLLKARSHNAIIMYVVTALIKQIILMYHWRRKRGGQGGHVPPHFFDRGGNGMFVPPHF